MASQNNFFPPPPNHPFKPPPPPPHQPSVPPPRPPVRPPPRPPIRPPPRPPVRPPPLPPPPPAPDNHPSVIVIVFISVGGVFFLAFLAAALFSFLKKRKKKTVKEAKVIRFDEHRKVKEAIVEGPHGSETVVLSVEDDIYIKEDKIKPEKVGHDHRHGLHAVSAEGNASTSSPSYHLEYKA